MYRGTCAYLSAKKTRTALICRHLHVHRMYYGTVRQPNQTACYVVGCTEDLGSFPTKRQLCSGLPQNSAASMTRIMCRTLGRRYETRLSWASEEQLGRKESVQPQLLPIWTRRPRRCVGCLIEMLSQETWMKKRLQLLVKKLLRFLLRRMQSQRLQYL